MPIATTARIVIIGAGAAGTALANHLVRRRTGAQVALVDARTEHLSQPGLSWIAAGRKPAGYRLSCTTDWLPQGITLLAEHAAIDPISKTVATTGGQNLSKDVLVVAPVTIVHEKVRMLFGQRGIAAHDGRARAAIDPGAKRATFVETVTDPVTRIQAKSRVERPCAIPTSSLWAAWWACQRARRQPGSRERCRWSRII